MTRKYVRVKPYRAQLAVGTIVNGFEILAFRRQTKHGSIVLARCPKCKQRRLRLFTNLRHMVSCGCWERKRHGGCHTPEYGVWSQMKQRCTNPKAVGYDRYGARGITISKSWMDFGNFIVDMGSRPSANHTLERKNGKLGYSKENCVWATRTEQIENRSNTVKITFQGETLSVGEWAKRLNMTRAGLRGRLSRMPLDRALTQPVAGGRRVKAVRFKAKEDDWKFIMRALRRAQSCDGPRATGECPTCKGLDGDHLPYCLVGRAIEKYDHRRLRRKGLVKYAGVRR